MTENFESLFEKSDLSDCLENQDFCLKRYFHKLYTCGESDVNYFIEILVPGVSVAIGEMRFVTRKDSIFLVQLRNRSIDAYTGERKYAKVGTSLINCAKKIAKLAGLSLITVCAQTPFSTPLPKNHNIVEFYEKQGFRLADSNGSAFMGYRMVHDVFKDALDCEK